MIKKAGTLDKTARFKQRAVDWFFDYIMEVNHTKSFSSKELKKIVDSALIDLRTRLDSHHKMLGLGYVWMPSHCVYIKPTSSKPTCVQVNDGVPQEGSDSNKLYSFMVHDSWMTPHFVAEANKILPLVYKSKSYKVRS